MTQTHICVLGLNHETAPIELRERFALCAEKLEEALVGARSSADEAVILSTCNRLEIYAVLPGNKQPHSLLKRVYGELSDEVKAHLYSYRGDEAIAHLFRVAAGIDSLVLGEVQILGQVQRAWQVAHKLDMAGPILSQLFHWAVALGKRVHSETSISRHPASVSYAAVVLARQIFGAQLVGRHALVIGTGEVGEGVARCLHDYGVSATIVAHRHFERATEIARRYEANTAQWEEMPHYLADADIVISSTSAPHFILQKQHIEEARSRRESRPLYLVDLAVPRDIDPEVAGIDGVFLHNVDDLQAVVNATMDDRRSSVPEIEGMISREGARFADWLKARSTAPTIKELQVQAGEITRKELEWAIAKLPNMSEREIQVVEALAARIAGKLLHGPIQWLKAQAEGARLPLTGHEPDYGMSKLSAAELEELFYRRRTTDG